MADYIDEEARRAQEEAERLAQEAAERARQEAEAQAAAAQEQAQQAAEEAQAQSEAAQKAAKEAIAKNQEIIESTPKHQQMQADAQFKEEQKAAREATRYEVVSKHPQMVSTLPEDVDVISGMNQASYEKDAGYSMLDIDFASLKNDKQAYYMASTMTTKEAKLAVLKGYADATGKDFNAVVDDAELMLGSRLFSQPYGNAAKTRAYDEQIASVPVYDIHGNKIDMAGLDLATAWKMSRFIPDAQERKTVQSAIIAKTKTPGSGFYGKSLPEDTPAGYLDNGNLTQSDYNAEVKKFSALFNDTEQDALNYADAKERIAHQYEGNPYAKLQLERALDKVYSDITGKNPTDLVLPEPEQTGREEDGGVFDTVMGFLGDLVDGFKGTETAQGEPKQETPAQEAQAEEEAAPQETSGSLTAELYPEQEEQPEAPKRVRASGGAEMPIAAASPAPMADAPDAQTNAPAAVPQNILDTADPAEALMGVWSGKYDDVTGEGRETIAPLLKSPSVQKMMGTVSDEDYAYIARAGNEISSELTGKNRLSLGASFNDLYTLAMSEDFPEALRPELMYDLAKMAYRADALEAAGILKGDEYLPSVERLMQTDTVTVKQVAEWYGVRDTLAQDMIEMRDVTAAGSEQALATSRKAWDNDAASIDQMRMWATHADVPQGEINADNGYSGRVAAVDDYFRRGVMGDPSPYENSSVRQGLNARGITDDSDYQAILRDQMNEVLTEDAKIAHSLGMNLDEFYAEKGGVSMDSLAAYAANRISEMGASISEEEIAELAQPEGDGVGMGYSIGAAARYGLEGLHNDNKTSLYVNTSIGKHQLEAETIRAKYQHDYGEWGRRQYVKDLQAAIDAGVVPEIMAQDLQNALYNAIDVYDIGINPADFGTEYMTNLAQETQQLETTAAYINENGTEGEKRAFQLVSSIVTNGAQMGGAVAGAAVGAWTGIGAYALGGQIASYAPSMWLQKTESLKNKGYGMQTARGMAAVQTTLGLAANYGTISKIAGQMGAKTLGSNFLVEASKKNPVGIFKGLAAIKSFAKKHPVAVAGVLTFAENQYDEAVKDEFVEKSADRWVENVFGGVMRKVDAGEEISFTDMLKYTVGAALNPKASDLFEISEEVLSDAPEAFLTSALFSMAGAAGEARSTYKSVKKAHDVATGKSTDVGGAVDALVEDLKNPQFEKEMNAVAENAREARAVVEEMIGGKDANGNMQKAAKAAEQADSHKQQADASKAAMDQSIVNMDEAYAAVMDGDPSEQNVQAYNDAVEAYAKNKTGYDEHAREYMQKKQEASEAFQARQNEARWYARMQMRREDAALREAVGADRMQIATRNGVVPAEGVANADFISDIKLMGEDIYTAPEQTETILTSDSGYEYVVPQDVDDLRKAQNATGFANAPDGFTQALNAWDGKETDLHFVVSETSDTLRNVGMQEGNIVLLSDKIAKIKVDHPGMTDEVISKVPDIVQNPVVIMRSRTVQNRVTMFGDVKDKNGVPVLAVVSLDPQKNTVTGVNFHKMNSVYGKDTDPQEFINRSEILWTDEKRVPEWTASTRLKLPFKSAQDGDSSTHSVAPERSDVKARKQDSDDAERILKMTGENRKKVKNVEQIARKFSKKLGVGGAIGTNRFDIPNEDVSDALGYYYGRKRFFATRVTEANSLQTIFHEIGHAVQEQLGIKSSKQMTDSWVQEFSNPGAYDPREYDDEAFAEFFWRWMRSDEEAADFAGQEYIDSLTEQLRARGLLKDVQNAQNEVRNLLSQDAMTRLGAMIVDSGHKDDSGGVREKLSSTARKMITDFVDANFPAEAVNDTIRDITQKNNVNIQYDLRAQGRLRDSAMDRASSYLTGEFLTDGDGKIVGASLSKRLADAGVSGKDFDDFIMYWVACAALDRETKRNYDAYTIQFNEETNEVEVVKESKQTKSFATISKDIVSMKDLKSMIAQYDQEKPQFKLGVQAIQAFNHDIMMAYMVKPGRMKQEQLLTMESMYPHYAPLRTYDVLRVKGQKGQGRTFEVQRIKGSTQTKINPMDSYVSMVNAMVLQDADNRVKQTVSRVYDRFRRKEGELGEGIGYYFREVKEGGGGNNIISVLEDDGRQRYFQILDPELMSMFAGNRNMETGLVTLGKMTRLMSRLTTGMNPFFGIRNFLRDFQSSVNYGTWATTYLDGSMKWLKTAWEVWQGKSDDWNEYVSMGGGGGTRLKSGTKKSNAQYRAEMFEGYEKQNLGKLKYAGKKLWALATAEKLNEVIEQTSRFVEYKLGSTERSTQDGRQRAFLNAQDVTIDFGRRGRSAAAATAAQVIPFFNAGIQGMYRTARQLSKAEADRSATRFIKTVANTALASAVANALCMRYLDDDEKEEYYYLSDDLKSKHFYIPNFWPDIMGDVPLIRIPIEQGIVAYGVNAAVSNAIWGKNADNEFAVEWAALGDTIVDGFTPVGSTIFDPVISMATNKNWYGSNIVPTYMSDYEAPAQYTEETADLFVWASEKLYNATGGKAAVSPMMIQYMAEQYAGYVGQTVIPFISKNKHAGEINGLDAVVGKLRKTLTSDPLKSNDVVSPVYDNFSTLNGIQKAGNAGKVIPSLNPALNDRQVKRAVDAAYDLTHSGGELYEAKKEISALYDEIDEITGNKRLSDSDKNALIEKRRREMIDIALDANRAMAEYEEAYMKGEGYLTRLLKGFVSLER